MPDRNYLASYVCTGCAATGVKLWRDYNTCAIYTTRSTC
jgi:hypothetical protein